MSSLSDVLIHLQEKKSLDHLENESTMRLNILLMQLGSFLSTYLSQKKSETGFISTYLSQKTEGSFENQLEECMEVHNKTLLAYPFFSSLLADDSRNSYQKNLKILFSVNVLGIQWLPLRLSICVDVLKLTLEHFSTDIEELAITCGLTGPQGIYGRYI